MNRRPTSSSTALRAHRRGAALAAAAVLAVAATVGVSLAGSAAGGTDKPGISGYQRVLRGQVQAADGSPRAGRDPATQQQTSLAAAASKPQGPGLRTGKPARELKGTKVRRAASSVLPNPKQDGMSSGGCAVGYGDPGAQCLPARAPGDRTVTCGFVTTLFPEGIRVTGRDRLRLDTNRDATACGHGDDGVRH